MGRELRRVPLDFDWPLNETWKGFINPHYEGHRLPCPKCKESKGYSDFAYNLDRVWNGYVEFKPEDNGREPYTADHPVLRAIATRSVTRHAEDMSGTNDPTDRFDWRGERATQWSLNFYGFDIREDIQRAIDIEAARLAELHNGRWSYHLNDEDVRVLIDSEIAGEGSNLWDFIRVPLRPITEEDIRNHAYYLWVEAGRPDGDGVEFWEESVKQHERHWLPYYNGYVPTADEVNEYNLTRLGGGSIGYYLIRNRCQKAGQPFLCDFCNGDGRYWDSPENEKLYDEWEETPPPAGEAYQIWETVSEGSPISPPFADPQDLAEYMVAHPWGADKHTTVAQWLKFINGPGWAPSGIYTPETGFVSGVEGIDLLSKE